MGEDKRILQALQIAAWIAAILGPIIAILIAKGCV